MAQSDPTPEPEDTAPVREGPAEVIPRSELVEVAPEPPADEVAPETTPVAAPVVAPEPEAEPEQAVVIEAPPPPPRRSRALWLWLLVPLGAVVGVLVGYNVMRREESLDPGAVAVPAARPTFVIGPPSSPVPVPSPSPVVEGSPAASVQDYVVQPGDTLRTIALNLYGNADEWPRLYAANRDQIGPDPDNLRAGMRLRVP